MLTSRRSPALTTPGAAIRTRASTRICPASASAPRLTRSASTVTCSLPAATRAPGDDADRPGGRKRAALDDIPQHGRVLTPGRYVGAEVAEDDGEPFEEKMQRLTATLRELQAEAAKLDAAIA